MDNLCEKKLDSQQVFDGHLLKVYSDKVELPNGKQSVREYIIHPGAVAVVPILEDGRVVMVRQYRYPTGEAILEIPAGKLDCGESPEKCALRELSEETGYRAGVLRKLTAIHTTPGFTNEIIHVYVAEQLEMAGQHTDEDEFVNIEVYTKEKLKAMIFDGQISDAKTIAGLLMAGI